MQRTGIGPEELAARRERLLDHAGTTVVLFDQAYIQYYTGFNFLSNERPVVVVVGDELTAFVPGFEVARTQAEGNFDRVEQYSEYPGPEHPMRSKWPSSSVRSTSNLGTNAVSASPTTTTTGRSLERKLKPV